MWNELTFLWNELTILWNDLTIDWNDLTWNDVNDLTMEQNDRLPSCPQQTTNEQIKIFVTENTESDTFCMEEYSEKYTMHCRLKFIVTLKVEKVYTLTGTEVTVTV